MTDSIENTGLQNPTRPRPWLDAYKFKKGQSGNPKGKRHGETSITAALRRQLARGDNANRIAKALVEAGLAGDTSAVKMLLERIDGKVASEISARVTGSIGPVAMPTQIVFAIPSNRRDDPCHRPGFIADDNAPALGDGPEVPQDSPKL